VLIKLSWRGLAVSEGQVRAAHWHGDIPLVVLTHGLVSPGDYGIPSMAAKGEKTPAADARSFGQAFFQK